MFQHAELMLRRDKVLHLLLSVTEYFWRLNLTNKTSTPNGHLFCDNSSIWGATVFHTVEWYNLSQHQCWWRLKYDTKLVQFGESTCSSAYTHFFFFFAECNPRLSKTQPDLNLSLWILELSMFFVNFCNIMGERWLWLWNPGTPHARCHSHLWLTYYL